ncbi:hypothetical protein [Rhodanobacter geophilus]|uniref:Uncharacterized protein n=1 Tax=Rhodanobacter geophilus TaxID=3162488 RepID=A0ABV3QL53_9GAMM
MKLLRDFLRLRTPRRSLLAVRRDARRRVFVVTVPAPLVPPSVEPQRQAEARNVASLSSPRHLQLASSH